MSVLTQGTQAYILVPAAPGNNHIFVTRYHAILIAQAEDSLVHSNTIHRAGAKSVMVGASNSVTCGAITLLGGGSAPGNLRIKVYDKMCFLKTNRLKWSLTQISPFKMLLPQSMGNMVYKP